jgi:hypothetical protein
MEISVKELGGLENLTGSANFHLWKDEMMIFFSIYGLESFVKGSDTQPDPSTAKTKEIESWDKKSKTVKFILYRTVDSSIKPILSAHATGPEGWKALCNKYDKRNPTTFHWLLKAILTLKYTNKDDIPNYITQFDQLWARLSERTVSNGSKDGDSLEAALRPLAQSPKAKVAFILTSLPSSLDNVIDNLTTKEGLTYDNVCGRLMDLVSTSKKIIEEDKALYGKAKGNKWSNKESKGKEKEVYCTVCKDNGKKERVWQLHHIKHCKSKKTDEVAKVAASDNDSDLTLIATDYALASSSNSTRSQHWKWIFDTGCFSHMTGNKANLFNLRSCFRRIKGISG